MRHTGVRIVSCPSCARQGFDVVRTVEGRERRLAHVTTLHQLVDCRMCCERPRGGPGETDIGLTGGKGNHMVYMAGQQDHMVGTEEMIDHLCAFG